MTIRQISVFIENKPGTMVKIADALGNAHVDIRALSVADTQDFGILRMIVDDVDKAKEAISRLGVATSITDVFAVEVSDEPGAMTDMLKFVSGSGLNIEYMYAFVSPKTKKAYIVLRIKDIEKAEKVFANSVLLLADEGTIV